MVNWFLSVSSFHFLFLVPLITELKVARMFVEALKRLDEAEKQGKPFWEIRSWDEYVMGL